MRWLDNITERLKRFADGLATRASEQQEPAQNMTLDEMLQEPEWTEQEICQWVEGLPVEHRRFILDRAKTAAAQSWEPLDFLRKARIEYETGQADARARSGPAPSLLDYWYAYETGKVAGDVFLGKYKPRGD